MEEWKSGRVEEWKSGRITEESNEDDESARTKAGESERRMKNEK
jgi:hypothetical protein